MRICSSRLSVSLFAVLVLFGEKCVYATPVPASSTTGDDATSSKFDTSTNVQPGVHNASDSKTETSTLSVAQISAGNKTIFTVNSGEANNNETESDSKLKNNSNDTSVGRKKKFDFFHNKGAMLRAFYVAIGILLIVTVYAFVVSRLKRRRTKRHNYSLLTKHADVELTPLGQDEEEEEHTVFDAVQYKS